MARKERARQKIHTEIQEKKGGIKREASHLSRKENM